VVSGRQHLGDKDRLRLVLPGVWTRLNEICHDLETLFRDAEDFEFTVQSGLLFLLQARRAKRTDWAPLAIAVDMVDEGLLTPGEALAHLDGINLDTVVRTSFALEINLDSRQCTIGGTVLNQGDFLSLDGNTGAVHPGCLTPLIERPERALAAIATWGHGADALHRPSSQPQVAF
jgi:Pyruvate phosphate dikinase, AMP/ATP-binding domain